jgi:D-xylose 1-dehydrogenase (NADP+, D-xylono-1,5-lactone-forming)
MMASIPPSDPLRIGILGTARIARSFISGVAPSKTVEVTAIASRQADKAQRFAEQTGVQRSFGSYVGLLADPTVDAVYIPLPNSLHAEWTIRAIQAGKHVLCEKPLAATAAEARAMFAAARSQGVMLVEGFPYRSQPQTAKLQELLTAGVIGKVQTIQAAMGFTVTDPLNIRLNPTLVGGVLMDAGIYPVSLIRLVAGERPGRVYAAARWHPNGVDQTLIASVEHPSGLLAQISCSFTTAMHRQALIAGTTGILRTTFMNNPPLDRPAELQVKQGLAPDSTFETIEVPAVNGFRAEAESFERLIRHGSSHWSGATPEESLDIMMTLEAMLNSARARRPVDLPDGALTPGS